MVKMIFIAFLKMIKKISITKGVFGCIQVIFLVLTRGTIYFVVRFSNERQSIAAKLQAKSQRT